LRRYAAVRRQLRKALAKAASNGRDGYVLWSDVYVQCLETSAARSASASVSPVIFGGCDVGTSVVAFEMYMKSSLISYAVSNLNTLLEANDGDPNPSGYVRGGTQYNYVFVADLQAFMAEDGVTVPLDQLRLWMGNFEPYSATACYGGYCLFRSHQRGGNSPQGPAGTAAAAFAPLNGRRTARVDDTSCGAGEEWRCLARNKINALRAEGGLRELAWNASREASAKGYAEELCRNGNMTHSNEAQIEWDAVNKTWKAVAQGENQHYTAGFGEVMCSNCGSYGNAEPGATSAGRGVMLARAIETLNNERNYYRYGKAFSECELNEAYNSPAGSGGGDNYVDYYAMPGGSFAGALSDLVPVKNRMTGHFYQLMYHRATEVGCYAARCGDDVPAGEPRESDAHRWIAICHFDAGVGGGELPFSPRAAKGFVQSLETRDTSDDKSLCFTPCAGALTSTEISAAAAFAGEQVNLTDAPEVGPLYKLNAVDA
jgi:hypothetical protein